MKLHATLLTAACALALSACGDRAPADAPSTATPPDAAATAGSDDKVDPATVPEAPMGQVPADASTPATGDTGDTAGDAGGTPGAEATPATSADGSAAAVSGCTAKIEGNDMMKYNVSSIVVPASCSQFTIELTHSGRLPEAAMGHNVVIAAASDMAGVAADGIAAGAPAGYLKAGDSRVIAATDMIGGGESSSVTFDVAKISSGGPFEFFCSFPGHSAMMKGTISVG